MVANVRRLSAWRPSTGHTPARDYLTPHVEAPLLTPSPVLRQWTDAVDGERVPQAVLLAGPEGAELLPLALKLVQYLQCTDRRPAAGAGDTAGFGESCNACDACRASLRLANPDVHFTFPVVGSKVTSQDHLPAWREAVLANPYLSHGDWLRALTNDNKLGNVNRDEVMRILHDVSLQRFTDGHKVVVIWGADYLGDEANRLLKVIEEPPERTLIVLITNRVERILPTILSRCRVYRLPLAPTGAIARLLAERNPGLDPARAEAIAYAAGGDIGRALAEAQRAGAGEGDPDAGPDLAGWLRACFAGRGAGIVKAAAAIAALTRERQKYFLLRALRFVRELGVARAGTPTPLRLAPAEREVAVKLAGLLDWRQLADLAAELERLRAAVERNANGKIAFAASSVRIHRILARPAAAPAPAAAPGSAPPARAA